MGGVRASVKHRRDGPASRSSAHVSVVELAGATVLGALPGTRRLDRWWIRQSWRRVLVYRLAAAAIGVALHEWGRQGFSTNRHAGIQGQRLTSLLARNVSGPP